MNIIRAEWIKFTTVPSPRWCYAAIAASTVLLAVAVTLSAPQTGQPVTPLAAATGLNAFGVVIFMVLAALQSTTEYRTGTMALTFQVTRRRVLSVLTKTALVAVVGAVAAALLAFVAVAIGASLDRSAQPLQLAGAAQERVYAGMPVVVFLACFLASGVANLIRNTAGTVAAVIIWPVLIEGLVTLVPHVGKRIASWLPFNNADYLLGDSQGLPFAWNHNVAAFVLLAWAAAAFGAGLLMVSRRDVG